MLKSRELAVELCGYINKYNAFHFSRALDVRGTHKTHFKPCDNYLGFSLFNSSLLKKPLRPANPLSEAEIYSNE